MFALHLGLGVVDVRLEVLPFDNTRNVGLGLTLAVALVPLLRVVFWLDRLKILETHMIHHGVILIQLVFHSPIVDIVSDRGRFALLSLHFVVPFVEADTLVGFNLEHGLHLHDVVRLVLLQGLEVLELYLLH